MLQEKKLSEIVSENYSSADIFIKYGIDFCCCGGTTFKHACESKNLDPNQIEKEISESLQRAEVLPHFQTMAECIDYILEKHHEFEIQLLRSLELSLEKLLQVHSNYQEIHRYQELLELLHQEIYPHFSKEENILFPMLKKMEKGETLVFPLEHALQPIFVMEGEHEKVGEIIREIIEYTSNFLHPEYACLTWKSFLESWKRLLGDIQKHVFVENEILFRMARNFIERRKLD